MNKPHTRGLPVSLSVVKEVMDERASDAVGACTGVVKLNCFEGGGEAGGLITGED